MASSKKYGYKLRGEKLSLLELDITGTGNGLNYTYEEGAGLDISTDPSAWKSPLTTVSDGLQIEYLPNKLELSELSAEPTLIPTIDASVSSMDDISMWDSQQDVWEDYGVTPSHPLVVSSATAIQKDGSSGNVLKIVRTEDTSLTSSSRANLIGVSTGLLDTKVGVSYKISIDLKANAVGGGYPSHGTVPTQIEIDYFTGSNDGSMPNITMQNIAAVQRPATELNPSSFLNSGISQSNLVLNHPESSSLGALNCDWVTCSFNFIANNEKTAFVFNIHEFGDIRNTDQFIYLDNFQLDEIFETVNHQDVASKDILLPSYAQKALLDYVRAQDAYENGDLEKWGFFMKQFRSKLERWEDSRITGPRVLGPHGPSSIR